MATLLDDIDDPAGFDLMKAVANPLPVTVIAEMLGVPPEDRARNRVFTVFEIPDRDARHDLVSARFNGR